METATCFRMLTAVVINIILIADTLLVIMLGKY